MCLNVLSGPHIAKRDISVFKLIYENNESKYMDFTYQPNTLQRIEELRPCGGQIEEGYHAFRYNAFAYKVDREGDVYMQGVEGYSWHDWACVGSQNLKFAAFTIPKGATYYLGHNGDIVASQIKSGSLKPMRPRDLRRPRKGNV